MSAAMTDDETQKAGEAYVALGSNPHENGSSLARAAERMLLDLGKSVESHEDVEVCEGCFWGSIATLAIIQAAAARNEGVVPVLIMVADTLKAMADGVKKPTCH